MSHVRFFCKPISNPITRKQREDRALIAYQEIKKNPQNEYKEDALVTFVTRIGSAHRHHAGFGEVSWSWLLTAANLGDPEAFIELAAWLNQRRRLCFEDDLKKLAPRFDTGYENPDEAPIDPRQKLIFELLAKAIEKGDQRALYELIERYTNDIICDIDSKSTPDQDAFERRRILLFKSMITAPLTINMAREQLWEFHQSTQNHLTYYRVMVLGRNYSVLMSAFQKLAAKNPDNIFDELANLDDREKIKNLLPERLQRRFVKRQLSYLAEMLDAIMIKANFSSDVSKLVLSYLVLENNLVGVNQRRIEMQEAVRLKTENSFSKRFRRFFACSAKQAVPDVSEFPMRADRRLG